MCPLDSELKVQSKFNLTQLVDIFPHLHLPDPLQELNLEFLIYFASTG